VGIGGPLEARARVRLGPASHGFYAVQPRPLWSSVIEVRTQFLIPGLDGDSKYVGRVQRGAVQPAVYGAGELNVWRFQFAPGVGILVGDRQAHADLSLRASVQLLDRLYGDVEVLRRQALSVPAEPGRCQSAWMGAAGARFQFRRGVFMNVRYVGGQGDCVPAHSFQANLGLAFGDGLLRIPNIDELEFIKKYHALLMGMIDPVLDCQGIMRADDGTPMFRFGYPDARDPRLIRRNNVEYHVGEHFWEKNGNLYRDTDLSHPVLDLHGESPLTFAERAAMHDCPTLPGLGSPCQLALNLPMLRHNVERSESAPQLVLNEDAQILACLNHLSPLKAAAVFASLQAALGPLLGKLPQVARWQNPAGPATPSGGAAPPASVATALAPAPLLQSGGSPKVAGPVHPTAYRGQPNRSPRKLGRPLRSAKSAEPAIEPPQLPSLPGWSGEEPSRAVAENKLPLVPSHRGARTDSTTPEPTSSTQAHGHPSPPSTGAQAEVPPIAASKTLPENPVQKSPPPAATRAAVEGGSEKGSPEAEPEPTGPRCGTYCKLTLGAVGTGLLVVGGAEVTKDALILGAAVSSPSLSLAAAGAAGGAVVGTIVADGVADHAMPPSAPADPAGLGSPDKPTSSGDNTASGESPEDTNKSRPSRGEVKGDLTQLQNEAIQHNQAGSREELAAIEHYAGQGHTVEKLAESRVKGQRTPDLRVDDKLVEIKARRTPNSKNWIKDQIADANDKYKNSAFRNSTGSLDLRLTNQGQPDAQVFEQAKSQIERLFRPDQYRSVSAVKLYNEGRLLGEWVRSGGEIILFKAP